MELSQYLAPAATPATPAHPGRYYIQSSDVHNFNDPRVNFIAVLTAITFIGADVIQGPPLPPTPETSRREGRALYDISSDVSRCPRLTPIFTRATRV
jgi:hypothetical protein